MFIYNFESQKAVELAKDLSIPGFSERHGHNMFFFNWLLSTLSINDLKSIQNFIKCITTYDYCTYKFTIENNTPMENYGRFEQQIQSELSKKEGSRWIKIFNNFKKIALENNTATSSKTEVTNIQEHEGLVLPIDLDDDDNEFSRTTRTP